jgi:tetratricopeptide (TPR) repeat protein
MPIKDWTAARLHLLLPAFLAVGLAPGARANEDRRAPSPAEKPQFYRPKLRPPATLEAVLRHLPPGDDAFPSEKHAQELAGLLNGLGARLRENPAQAPAAMAPLLAADFKGGRLTPATEVSIGRTSSLEVFRATAMSGDLVRDRASFGAEVSALLADFQSVRVAEFLITAIEVSRDPGSAVRTIVRYDLAGVGSKAWRLEAVGHWQIKWRRIESSWRVVEWTPLDHRRSRAPDPVFTETTGAAFGRSPAFEEQLGPGLDHWLNRLDAAFLGGGMGHHGVSVGDVDGDGLDDFYVAQPSGLPNRLFRNRGDGTFDDVTEAAGLLVLDSTSTSLFADVDNDGDQDLVVVTRSGPLLFRNDGKAHFSPESDAFHFEEPLRGSLTSAAMADYDRDGFLDLYLCAYSFFIGASEDKAGPPTPYHDAQNGPPNVLLRNDGHGHFVEVTHAAGLDQNNDRFSFAAAWADYDEDGWPDLLVANDFGRKNLYHNDGMKDGQVHFTDVAGPAGVEDYGAGMSAAFFDFDGDGHLDLYTGNMWTAAGLRITAQPGFMPDAPAGIRELYRRHARGNSLFRNRGDGRFEDVTIAAGAQMGRWAWSSDALDFDSDGWEDLYVVNGMFTRDTDEDSLDVDSFFWRQVTAMSPLERRTGTAYDDAWRATNRLLVRNGSQASHERKVLLRNDGRGGFDEVAGTVGLDLDQDGRSFAVFDYDQDGDPDIVVLAPRSSPELRLFRNDFKGRTAALALRLTGTRSNRDAVGARVTVEADQLRCTKIVKAGSGFISQSSKELLFGLGQSQRIAKVTIQWPSGATQTLSDVPLNHRLLVEEGNERFRSEAFRPSPSGPPAPIAPKAEGVAMPSLGTWLYQPYPAPDFTLTDLDGQSHSLSGARGKPTVVIFWASRATRSRGALEELARQGSALEQAGTRIATVALDPREDEAKVRSAAQGLRVPVAMATPEVAGTYAILNRYLFDRKEDLRLPTALLVDGKGDIVKVYRDQISASQIVADLGSIEVSAAERLARAVPFPGKFYTSPGQRNYFQYGLELSEQGFDTPALVAFERVAEVDSSPITFYNLGTLYMKGARPTQAQAAFERALALQPGYPEASNSLGALLAQSGDVPHAIERFRTALKGKPNFADALNNLGYALFQTGQSQEAADLYTKALAAQPGFPEALNNLGILFGQQGDLGRAEPYFKEAVEGRPGYGEAANNLAQVRNARGDTEGAIVVLKRLLEESPGFEMGYVTLSRIYLGVGRRQEGIQVLERLLQRNPSHPLGREILRQLQAGP